jgi:hypothetical protein
MRTFKTKGKRMNYGKMSLLGLLLIAGLSMFAKDEQPYESCKIKDTLKFGLLDQNGNCLEDGEACITNDGEEGTVQVLSPSQHSAVVSCKKN